MLDQWLDQKVRTKNRPKTYHSYSQLLRLYIRPALGKIPVDRLSALDIDRLLTSKQDAGLSTRTVAYNRAIIRMALAQAVRWGLVSRNVATLTEPRKVERG